MIPFNQFLKETTVGGQPSDLIARIVKEINSRIKTLKVFYQFRPADRLSRFDHHVILLKKNGKLVEEHPYEESKDALKKVQEIRKQFVDFGF